MKTINLNTGEGVHITVFPDGQPHVNISGLNEGEAVTVICSLTGSDKLLQLLQTANALENAFARKAKLVIPYLLGARYDRLMLPGDSIDLKVTADLINLCGFEKVVLFDVHSEVALLLIKNAVGVSNKELVMQYSQPDAVLICPDAGAAKKVSSYVEWNNNLTEIIYCNKHRDLATGRITLQVLQPEKCKGRNCVIIDDICDGGGTFLAVAQQIEPVHLTLIVTHGIFSKGFEQLEKHFQQIIVSDSLCKTYESKIITQINVNHLKSDISVQ
jgi:ribose-phosphate pyrophosphokinase